MVYRKLQALLIVLMFAAGFSATASTLWAEDEIPRISKEDAREKLDDPEVIFIDVRLAGDWKEDRLKIKGAVREDPDSVAQWLVNYDKGKTYMVYCA